MRLRNYFFPIVNWYFGVATPPYTPAVFCFCCHNFFYIATFILYNGWGDFLVQTKLLKGHIGTILWCNFLCKLDCKYCWKISRHKLKQRVFRIYPLEKNEAEVRSNTDVYSFTKETSQKIQKKRYRYLCKVQRVLT